MKILQLISSAGFYGAENVVLELSTELRNLGIDSVLGIFNNLQNPHTELVRFGQERGLQTYLLECRGQADWKTLYQLARFVREERIDIVHTHGYKSNIYGLATSRLLGKQSVSTCHNWIANDLKTRTYYRIDKAILPRFSRVVGVSQKIIEELIRIQVHPDKLRLISNGISLARFAGGSGHLRAELKIDPMTSVVGVVARMTPEKGLFHFIDAAKAMLTDLPGTRFLLVGDGPLREELEKRVRELGIATQVIFAGSRSNMPEVYRTMDVFVLPSLNEGLPMALLEAMAASVPVVATEVGEIPKLIRPSREGLLIPPGDSKALAMAIAQLLHNLELSAIMASKAFTRVSELYSSKRMGEQYLELYTKICQKSRNTRYPQTTVGTQR